MSETKYIPHNSFLACDKGSAPSRLTVTNDNGGRLYGQKLASEADVVPGVNIRPMGACAVTQSACAFAPIYWDKCNPDAIINGFKLVYEDAFLLCAVGGKISVSFETPPVFLEEMDAELGPDGSWILGLAIGNEQGMLLTDKFAQYSSQVAAARPNLNATDTGIRGAAKEAFGENLSKLDFQARGYEVTGAPHNRAFEPGIDVVARDPRADIDILEETKYKSGNGRPYTSSRMTQSGRQGSTQWFRDRLDGRVPPADAARIDGRLVSNSSQLQRTITKVDPAGNVTRHNLLPDGRTGAPTSLPPANVVRGGTQAGDFINDLGRGIQSNAGVANANQWLTRNAHTVSRVGKVVGRGAFVVGIVSDGYNIYSAYEEEGEIGEKTEAAIGSAAGGMAGGLAGAKVGAAIGALGGPIGAIAGGIIGGAIGGIAGSGLGSAIAGWF